MNNTVLPDKQNPDNIIVIAPEQCEIHGWPVGSAQPVTRRMIEVADANGYDIYIHSFRHNRSIKLFSNEYELIN